MDLIGPFSPLAGDRYKYVLTMLDLYSRHIQVVPLEDKRAETVVEALVFRVLLEQGVPEVLYSAQGSEFKNQRFTLTNSPHSNNVERLHQTLGTLVRMLRSMQ